MLRILFCKRFYDTLCRRIVFKTTFEERHKQIFFVLRVVQHLVVVQTEKDKVHKSFGSRNQEGNKKIDDVSAKKRENRKLDMI